MESSRGISIVNSKGNPLSLQYSDTHLAIVHNDGRKSQVELRQVLQAQLLQDENSIEVSYVARIKKNARYSLIKIAGTLKKDTVNEARAWIEDLMQVAYPSIKPFRRLKVLLNPFSGTSKGPSTWAKSVEPVFRAAGCTIDLQKTTHKNHGREIAKALDLTKFDVIVTASGDGLVHEVLNGFAEHVRPVQAFSLPLAPIPTGSGNGLSQNLLGLDNGLDCIAAALNVIKGRPMKIDLFALTQKEKTTYSFFTQTMGLMADVDLGTENMRWMGDTRFMVGFLRGLLAQKPCPFKMWIKVAETDKEKMAAAQQARMKEGFTPESKDEPLESLPPLKYSPTDQEGWIEWDKPLSFFYGGSGPFISRDLMGFPVSVAGDGFIDLALQEMTTRGELLAGIGGAPKGESYWMKTNHYMKAHAYRIKPNLTSGYFSVDGEAMPYEEYQVEVHPRLATLLSPTGHWAAELFKPTPPPTKVVQSTKKK